VNLETGMSAPTFVLDGFGPLATARPSSLQEIGALIRQAAGQNTAIYPHGGQTKLGLGMTPTKPGCAVDLRGLAAVIDFPARDMTVTVQTGITVMALHEMLAQENLRLPIDVPQADRATLGGILAANTCGPRRYGYGTLRDYVIGISAVNDEGNEFKAGGRVVKNVAGYDLCKLLVGSLGTLGIITQVTLKLRPLAEEQAVLCLLCEPANVETILAGVHGSRTGPTSVDLLNRVAAQAVFASAKIALPYAPWMVLVGYEGNADAVHWQVQQIVKEVGSLCQVVARLSFTVRPLHDALVEFTAWPEARLAFKANLLPSAVAAFCQAADQAPDRPALCAHAGNGIVHGFWPGDLTMDQANSMLSTWRERARAGQGSVIVSRCPPEWKATLNVWGPAPGDAWLMREVKAKFDPKRIFNPGRFIDGT
jgi:glycolate oxidase FAD binding subunit